MLWNYIIKINYLSYFYTLHTLHFEVAFLPMQFYFANCPGYNFTVIEKNMADVSRRLYFTFPFLAATFIKYYSDVFLTRNILQQLKLNLLLRCLFFAYFLLFASRARRVFPHCKYKGVRLCNITPRPHTTTIAKSIYVDNVCKCLFQFGRRYNDNVRGVKIVSHYGY